MGNEESRRKLVEIPLALSHAGSVILYVHNTKSYYLNYIMNIVQNFLAEF